MREVGVTEGKRKGPNASAGERGKMLANEKGGKAQVREKGTMLVRDKGKGVTK